MDEEVTRWMERAEQDLGDAVYLLKGARYSSALFACEQAVEKALKALLLFKEGAVQKTHDLKELAKRTTLPAHFIDALERLMNAYIEVRYPVANTIEPDQETVESLLLQTKEILRWINVELSTSS